MFLKRFYLFICEREQNEREKTHDWGKGQKEREKQAPP